MSDAHASHAHPPESSSPLLHRGDAGLFHVGVGLGMAGAFVGLAVFLGACMGYEAALMFSVLPLALGAAGLLLTIFGAIRANVEATHVVASLFFSLFALVGAALEMAAWRGWTVFFRQSSP